jgi:hypothetical protein
MIRHSFLLISMLALAACDQTASAPADASSNSDTSAASDAASDAASSDASSDAASSDASSDAASSDASSDAGADASRDASPAQFACGPTLRCNVGTQICRTTNRPATCPADPTPENCRDGCRGCPALPDPTCVDVPAACAATPTCTCIVGAICTSMPGLSHACTDATGVALQCTSAF